MYLTFGNYTDCTDTNNVRNSKITGYKIRENFKYYFADFVRKGGGIPPKSVTPYLPKILSVKGGGGGVPPISVRGRCKIKK